MLYHQDILKDMKCYLEEENSWNPIIEETKVINHEVQEEWGQLGDLYKVKLNRGALVTLPLPHHKIPCTGIYLGM